MNAQEMLKIISKSIEFRNSAQSLDKDALYRAVKEVGQYDLWSTRQIVSMCDKKVSHGTVAKLITKKDKRGGKLNPQHLEALREIIFQKSINKVNWGTVSEVLSSGTSVDMLVRVTGLPKTTVYRKASLG